ncbi:hypothetical protein VTK73DRAFT_1500 [Phialemonium thermophilum]|uniref:Uncharacterized protein n=1 Tax=Phialemonium thermophilum TaxID=223376 RepID=A0ABR3VTC9_9PEZI
MWKGGRKGNTGLGERHPFLYFLALAKAPVWFPTATGTSIFAVPCRQASLQDQAGWSVLRPGQEASSPRSPNVVQTKWQETTRGGRRKEGAKHGAEVEDRLWSGRTMLPLQGRCDPCLLPRGRRDQVLDVGPGLAWNGQGRRSPSYGDPRKALCRSACTRAMAARYRRPRLPSHP